MILLAMPFLMIVLPCLIYWIITSDYVSFGLSFWLYWFMIIAIWLIFFVQDCIKSIWDYLDWKIEKEDNSQRETEYSWVSLNDINISKKDISEQFFKSWFDCWRKTKEEWISKNLTSK